MTIDNRQWAAAAVGAIAFTLLRVGAHAATGRTVSPGDLALTMLFGSVVAVAVVLVVASAGPTPGRAMLRALLFCVVPAAAVAGGAAAGQVDRLPAFYGVCALVTGSLLTAWLAASGSLAQR